MKIRIVKWAAFIKEFITKRKFNATILGWTISMNPDQFDVWHFSKMGPDELNFISYKNPEMDDLFEKGRSTFNVEEREKAYSRIQEILAEDQPYVFFYVPDALPMVMSGTVCNLV